MTTLLLALTALCIGTPSALAKGDPGTPSFASGSGANALNSAPASAQTWNLKGGYTAAGVALRNRGFGTISLGGIPSGASIVSAYLTWTVLNPTETANLNDGVFNGTAIAGARVGTGADPCWGAGAGYTYRANVTSQVTGNGSYGLTGFASGRTDAAQPASGDAMPYAEGASLVVVYSKPTYPQTWIQLRGGYHNNVSSGTMVVDWGFPATNPVGETKTTFMIADGQVFADPNPTINGIGHSLDQDGTDPPFPTYTNGNLWDTDTLPLRNVVKPGDTEAVITLPKQTADCVVWAGQVFSLGVNGALDTDGDKLLDGWEAQGYDYLNNGTIDLNLPAWGSSVVKKDLYVEMDYMGAEAACPCHLPLAADLVRIRSVFSTAPVTNPNGTTGINLHLDAGAARGSGFNLGGGNLVAHDDDLNPVLTEFNAIRSANFNAAVRDKIFYYMIWAHGYDGGSSSGNAFAIPNDRFVVTLGLWANHGSSDEKVGTFVHEFGHDLGLGHGGSNGVNYKPNYLSVMSYANQVNGVARVSGAPYFGFSNADLPDLNENNLNESVGLNSSFAAPFRTRYFCGNGGGFTITPGTANGPIDWSCGGLIQPGTVADINGDSSFSTLTGWNDWASLVYGGGLVGGGVSPNVASVPKELTYEEHQNHSHP